MSICSTTLTSMSSRSLLDRVGAHTILRSRCSDHPLLAHAWARSMIAATEKCEWVFGRVVAPAPRGVVLVDVLLAVAARANEVLGMRVTAVERGTRLLTEIPAAVADTVVDAMRDAPPPALIRATNEDLAHEARTIMGTGTTIIVAPTPEIDAIAPEIREALRLAGRTARRSLAGTPAAARELYLGAARLWASSPWELLDGMVPLAVDVPEFEIDEGYLAVFSSARHQHQIALFASRADYVRVVVHLLLDSPGDESGGFGCDFLLLQFRELSPESRAALDDWPLPQHASFPVVISVRGDGTTERATSRQLRVMAAMCRSLAVFAREHRDALAAGASDGLDVHVCTHEGPEVWLWLEPDDGIDRSN